MASSSSSSSSSSTRSWKYDVFLSFRGEDTRKTFVDHLYSALEHHRICTYKDDVTLPRGDTIGPSLLNAIQDSQIAVVVFSENYADSSWCLEELEHIMKCRHERGQIVLPVFYNVDPSHVRKQKGKYEEAFAKHTSTSDKKVETWSKALVDASNIAGWETKHIANGHEAVGIKTIVDTILDTLLSVSSAVDKNLVGMGSRFQYLESQLQIGSGGVSMIGIWGVGGGGKTTLAFSIYMKIRDRFHGHCFIGNIREESAKYGLHKLQEKVLSQVLKKQVWVFCVQEGGCIIEDMLGRRNVLIVLDDVDDVEQLQALAGSHDWFGDGSRIIITTRDEHVLISHGVDVVSPISLLSDDEAIRLFRRYAYHKNNPVEDYDKLSFRVITYVHGLPLALKILGSFLYDKDKNEWINALDKLREIPNSKVMEQLKISYNGLDRDEKELFLDIACFFRGECKEEAMKMLDACGFHPRIGIKVLIQKALITISSDGHFDMHDLVQEMGHHIVRGKHPNNPEKHSRLWRSREISDMGSGNVTMENHKIEAIRYNNFVPPKQGFMTLVSNLKKLRSLDVTIWGDRCCDDGPTFLSNELKYMSWYGYPASAFPESFQPRKLVVLKIKNTLQKELWKGYKYLPCLIELELTDAGALVRTPDFVGLPCLQKVTLSQCSSLEEIHPSIGSHSSLVYISVHWCRKLTSFPSIVRMEKLEILEISDCEALLEFPKIEANMDSLVNLSLNNVGIEVLPSSAGRYCTNLQELHLCNNRFSRLDFSLFQLTRLKLLNLSQCKNLVELPELPSSIVSLQADDCDSLEAIRDDVHRNCNWLCKVSITSYWRCRFVGGERLLETMLQGMAIGNHQCMSLLLKEIEIPKGFEARLVRGSRYRLKLAKNWFNEYTGFLFCSVFKERSFPLDDVKITLRNGMGDSQYEQVFWEDIVEEKESLNGYLKEGRLVAVEQSYREIVEDTSTWVGYVSFGSLRCTAWWDQTSTSVDFSIDLPNGKSHISGVGVKLVSKKNQMKEMTTTTNFPSEFSDDDYKCKFKIRHDSRSLLEGQFENLYKPVTPTVPHLKLPREPLNN